MRVSETPGKTKHFQTLELTEDVTLCDCPGLVMPSLANSKAGMVLQVSKIENYISICNFTKKKGLTLNNLKFMSVEKSIF